MKRFFVVFSLLVFNSLITPAISAAPVSSTGLGVFPASLNVKDFGAKGDGIADDTKAIQATVNASISQSQKWPSEVRHWNHLKKGISDNPHPEIVFPEGTYKISGTIVFTRYAYLRGFGKAVIQQADPTKDSFYFHTLLRSTVENLHFEGGKIQLRFWTANNGTARVTVQRCNFSNSGDYAVECRSYTRQRLTGDTWNLSKPWAPYDVQWIDGTPRLTANDAKDLVGWANSTSIRITHCRFENVMHALDLSADTATVSDCVVNTNPQMEGAVFNLVGKIHFYRIKGLARLDAKKHQYWFQTGGYIFYTNLSLRDSDFDTNTQQGICLLRSAMLPVSTSIILENNRVKSAGSLEGAMLWIAKDTQPNIISINGMTESSGKPIKAVTWEQTPDAATLEKIKDQPKGARSDYIYKLQISGNSPTVNDSTPEIFAPLLLKPVPASAIIETFVAELPWNYSDLEAQAIVADRVLQATDYGVDQDPKTDDTAAVQKTFDAAAKQGNSLVIFPAGVITLSETIHLPPNVVVRAAGIASFVLENAEKDIFAAANTETIGFKNCDFSGGRNGLNIRSAADAKARLAFDNCSFYDQEENGIHALAGKGEIGEQNQTELHVQGGIFATMRALTTNAAHSQLDTFWAMNDPRLNDDAFIRNQGGSMRVQAMLGNPVSWQGKRSKPPTGINDWQFSKNTRWFDNWGKLYSLDNRFGGEGGGIGNVVNRSVSGTVYIGGGITRFYNGATRSSILYQEERPQRAVLTNISSTPIRVDGGLSVMNADGSDGRTNPNVIVRAVPAP